MITPEGCALCKGCNNIQDNGFIYLMRRFWASPQEGEALPCIFWKKGDLEKELVVGGKVTGPQSAKGLRCEKCNTITFFYHEGEIKPAFLECSICSTKMQKGLIYPYVFFHWPPSAMELWWKGSDDKKEERITLSADKNFSVDALAGIEISPRYAKASRCRECKAITFQYSERK